MEQELKDILSFEKETILSWFDWWNYWAPSIGIIIFIAVFVSITMCYYSMSPRNKGQSDSAAPNEQEMEVLVNTLLHQKRLTL